MAVIRPSVVCREEWIVVPAIAGGVIAVILNPVDIRNIISCLAPPIEDWRRTRAAIRRARFTEPQSFSGRTG